MRAHIDQGFALPLALIGALAVLLSASSVMAMALGSRQQLQLELRTIQAVDELASAASGTLALPAGSFFRGVERVRLRSSASAKLGGAEGLAAIAPGRRSVLVGAPGQWSQAPLPLGSLGLEGAPVDAAA